MSDAVFYAELLADQARIGGFRRAIHAVVQAGDTVADLGTGLGTYAFFAAQAGAGRVWGVDSGPVIHLARQLALINGISDRVELVHGSVPDTPLPSPLDVLVFEDFPRVFLDAPTYDLLAYAQAAMGPGARMIPCGARLCVAPVGSDVLARADLPLGGEGTDETGLDWSPLSFVLVNCPRRADLRPQRLLAPPFCSPRVSLYPLPAASALRVEGSGQLRQEAVVHALAFWFDLELSPGVWISNGPGEVPGAWGQTVLPLDPPVEVTAGSSLDVAVWREGLENGSPGWLAWKARAANDSSQGHEFGGLLIGPEDIRPGPPAGGN